MPRELTLVSTEPWTLPLLVPAAVRVDGTLAPRMLFDGWFTQLVDSADVAVLTVELSRCVDDPFDIERLTELPRGGRLPTQAQVWWTEATAPWGPAGEPGVRIARNLAEVLGARLLVTDGSTQ